MTNRDRFAIATIFLLASLLLGKPASTQSTLAGITFSSGVISGNIAHTAIPAGSLPAAGTYALFAGTDGVWVWQQTAWFQIQSVPPPSLGVSSITVCGASGAPCSAAQTGAVTLAIPTKVVLTAVSPTGVLQ